LVEYYHRLTHYFAAIPSPLTNLLGSVLWHWTPLQSEALPGSSKNSPTPLYSHSPTHPFTILYGTRASDVAFAVLQKDHGQGSQPVAHLSRKLTTTQAHYGVHEKEMLPIVEALKAWRHHLTAYTVQVRTDHVKLRYFTQQPRQNPPQVRWAQFLADFDLNIKYLPGRKSTVPDALSRWPDLKLVILAATAITAPTSDLSQRIQAAYPADATASHLLQTATHKANPAYRGIAGFLYFVNKGCYRLYVPQKAVLRREILSHYHDHHSAGQPGPNPMKLTIRVHFYWPQMRTNISD
jgi:hypothetical protein